MQELELISPQENFYHEIEELFGRDPEIRIIVNRDTYEVKIYVDNSGKAEALMMLLPQEKVFGNIIIKIKVIPANFEGNTNAELFRRAFSGNPVFSEVYSVNDVMGFSADYVIFRKEVVQYRSDDLGDAHGMRSTLYQTIARDIFPDIKGVFFCTDTKDPDQTED